MYLINKKEENDKIAKKKKKRLKKYLKKIIRQFLNQEKQKIMKTYKVFSAMNRLDKKLKDCIVYFDCNKIFNKKKKKII